MRSKKKVQGNPATKSAPAAQMVEIERPAQVPVQAERARGGMAGSSEEFLRQASAKFGIEGPLLPAFERFVERAIGFYRASANVPTVKRQQITIREKLAELAAAHHQLDDLLGNLTALERDRLWCSVWEDENRLRRTYGLGDPMASNPFPDELSFREMLDAFGKRVNARLAELQDIKDRGGRRARTDLRIFVADARRFWEGTLGQKFAYSALGGTPKGKAFNFCRFVMNAIDTSVSDTELGTAMRTAIKPMKATIRVHSSLFRKNGAMKSGKLRA